MYIYIYMYYIYIYIYRNPANHEKFLWRRQTTSRTVGFLPGYPDDPIWRKSPTYNRQYAVTGNITINIITYHNQSTLVLLMAQMPLCFFLDFIGFHDGTVGRTCFSLSPTISSWYMMAYGPTCSIKLDRTEWYICHVWMVIRKTQW